MRVRNSSKICNLDNVFLTECHNEYFIFISQVTIVKRVQGQKHNGPARRAPGQMRQIYKKSRTVMNVLKENIVLQGVQSPVEFAQQVTTVLRVSKDNF